MEAHEVLGIAADASEDRVRAAFKTLALKWHPDRHPAYSRDEATAKFVEINKANRTMLRNIRRARRSEHSSQASNASSSSQSSPETRSTTLPDESSAASCSGHSESSSSSASECSHSSASSSSSSSSSSRPSTPSTEDEPQRPSSPDSAGTTATGTQKPTRSRIRKQSRSTSTRPDPITGKCTPKSLHRHQGSTGSAHADLGPARKEQTLHPVRSILRGAGTDTPKRWIHVLDMSLDDLYFGKTFYFRVVRYRRSGRKTIVPLEVHVPPGTFAGTEIVVEGVGNECKDGTMQAIVFLVKEMKHERFTRMQEDLLMEVRLAWVDSLNQESGRVYFQSIDGKECMFNVDYHMNGLLSGTTVIPDAGMPSCDGPGRGRGRVVIRWEISSPKSSWGTLKQVLKFKG